MGVGGGGKGRGGGGGAGMKMESNVSTSRFVTTAAAHAAGTSYETPENHQKHAKNRSVLEAFKV